MKQIINLKNVVRICLLLVVAVQVQATTFNTNSDFTGFVNIGAKELFVKYSAPAQNKPTLILLNGLTYSTNQWFAMTYYLKQQGFGVLAYDMDGMGLTLLRYGVKTEPYNYSDQVDDLLKLLNTLKISQPYNLVGLSYGGGIGAAFSFKYPQFVNKLVMMAPYTQPLQKQDESIKQQISYTRMMFPMNPASDDQLYDYYLRQSVYTTYPSAEPIVLENPIKLEAVFRLTQGIRKLNVISEVAKFPKKSVYLIIARNDQYIPADVLENFWNAIPETSRVEKIYIENSEHKIPEARPLKAAEVLGTIFSK